jgi:hypothetical protein
MGIPSQKEAIATMKVTKLTKTVLLAIALVGIGLAPTARAAHATNFLDVLQMDVTDRLANADTNTAAERRALTTAARTLNKNTKTLAADLGVLASAATTLHKGFSNDVVLTAEEELALSLYSNEAHAQLATVIALAGPNPFPKSISNQLNQAQAALDRGDASSNSVPVRAKAIAFALNKIRVASLQAHRLFKAPLSLGSGATISTRSGDIVLNGDGTYTIGDPSAPDETGTWTYERTSPNTALVTLSSGGTVIGTLNLKFANANGGTVTGEKGGENLRGRFSVTTE